MTSEPRETNSYWMTFCGMSMKRGDPSVAPTPTARTVPNPYTGFARSTLRGLLNLTLRDSGRDATSARPVSARLMAATATITSPRLAPPCWEMYATSS